MIRQFLFVICFQLLFVNTAAIAQQSSTQKKFDYLVSADEATQKPGNLFMSSKEKGEVLLKVNIWGSVNSPGVHFVPMGTRLLDAISFAGGPSVKADIDSVVYSSSASELKMQEISLTKAMNFDEKSNPVLKSGDQILLNSDNTRENISLGLSIGTFSISVISLILLLNK